MKRLLALCLCFILCAGLFVPMQTEAYAENGKIQIPNIVKKGKDAGDAKQPQTVPGKKANRDEEGKPAQSDIKSYPDVTEYFTDLNLELVLFDNGLLYAQTSNRDLVKALETWTDIRHFETSSGRVAAITESNKVLSYGFDSAMEKDMSRWDDIEKLFIAEQFVIGFKFDGTAVYTADPEATVRLFGLRELDSWKYIFQTDSAVCSSGSALVAVDHDGRVYGLGLGAYMQESCDNFEGIRDGRIVSTSGWINFCIGYDDTVYYWGTDSDLYDRRQLQRENLDAILPLDCLSIGIRKDDSLVYLGDAEALAEEDLEAAVNACRDVSIVDYSGGTIYVLHKDGSFTFIEDYSDKDSAALCAMMEQWPAIDNLALGRYYAMGLGRDGETYIATLHENSLLDQQLVPGDLCFGDSEESDKVYVDYYCYSDRYEAALCSDGTVTINGKVDAADRKEVESWSNVESISGFNHMLAAITKDGKVLSVGFDEELEDELADWNNISMLFFWDDFVVGMRKDGRMEYAAPDKPFFDYVNFEDVKSWTNVEQIHGMTCPMQPWLVGKTSSGKVYTVEADLGSKELNDSVNLLDSINDARSVSTTGYVSLCVHNDGSITGWGPVKADLNEDALARKDYVYALGMLAIRKDHSLAYLYGDNVDAYDKFENVKDICTDGENYFALMTDGSVAPVILRTGYSQQEIEYLTQEISRWSHIDTIEADHGYVIGRGIDASIQVATIFPDSIFS